MATLEWAHLCAYYVRGIDGRLSLIDIIDVIRAPKCPAVISVCVVTCWAGVPDEKLTFGCHLRGPDNHAIPIIKDIEVPFRVHQPNAGITEIKTTATVAPHMVELKQYGVYSVDVVAREIVIHTLPFHFVPVRTG